MPFAPVLVAALAALLASPAHAEQACHGSLSGSVKASFDCTVTVAAGDDGKAFFVVRANAPMDGVPACVPGGFELPGPPKRTTYTLETLGQGMASVAAEGGTLYTATKTTGQRGEVALRFTAVRKSGVGAWDVHGTYRARLVPAGGGKQGEVVVDVSF